MSRIPSTWLAALLVSAGLVGCGGGGSAGATGGAIHEAGGALADTSPSVLLYEPLRVGVGSQIALSWQLEGSPTSIDVLVQHAVGEAFLPVTAEVGDNGADFDRGPARDYDFPTARVRVRACDSTGCTDSNEQSLTEVLLAGVPQLRADPPTPEAVFGSPLSFSADGRRVAVVARGNLASSPEMPDLGKVFVYDRAADGAWAQTAVIERPGVLNDFGAWVALSGDGNTMAVSSSTDAGQVGGIGAPEVPGLGLAGPGNHRGAVHLYVRGVGGQWTRQAFIKPATTLPDELFGLSLALGRDGDDLVVSARERALLFRRDAAGQWQEVRRFEPLLSQGLPGHGATLSADGGTVALPRVHPSCAPGTPQIVAIEVFRRRGSGPLPVWDGVGMLTASQPGANLLTNPALDATGSTLAVGATDDRASDADGTPTAATAPGSGAVQLFRATPGGRWAPAELLKSRAAMAGDGLGRSVRISADGTVVAAEARGMVQNVPGLHRNHAAGAEIDPLLLAEVGELGGAVYVFEQRAAGWSHVANALLGEPGVPWSAPFFGFDLSGDAATLGLGSTVFSEPKDAYVKVF